MMMKGFCDAVSLRVVRNVAKARLTRLVDWVLGDNVNGNLVTVAVNSSLDQISNRSSGN